MRIFLLCGLVIILSACQEEKKSLQQPNVIILMTDDQGYGDLACHGNSIIKTPNLDKLHSESIRFTDFHVDPTCSPTRAALMTGHYSRRAGVWHTIMGRNFLRRNETTMAEIFKASGYKTGHFGKWHLGGSYPYRPIDRGFDYWVGHGDGGTGTANDFWGNDKMNDTYLRNGKWEKFEGFSTDIYFNETIKFIERNKQNPFFIYLATNVPHRPWNIKKEWLDPYKDKIDGEYFEMAYFYASISHIDYNLGKLRNYLEEEGLSDNTIFIFLTDNGTSGGIITDKHQFRDGPGFNDGMRGMKGSEYEGGHRVPLFISWPEGNIHHGKDETYLCAHIDILPTLIDLCDLGKPENLKFDGLSLVPFLHDAEVKPDSRIILVESQRIMYPEKWRKSCVMSDTWRLINGQELYHIINDPGQQNNVADEYPDVLAELKKSYEEFWDELSANDSIYERQLVGAEDFPSIELYGQDWVPLPSECPFGCPWDQKMHILEGSMCNGFWPVEVAAEGKYRISLRRWPDELGISISGAPEENKNSDIWAAGKGKEPEPVVMGPGKSLTVKKAGIQIGNKIFEKEVYSKDKEAMFITDLVKGNTDLHAWFITDHGRKFGAYYVDVELISLLSENN